MDPSSATPKAPDTPEPEKYIRTFQGDMETVQKGGVPDLTPFADTPDTPAVPPPPAPAPVTPEPPSEPATAAQPKISPVGPPPLKTYAGDFSKRMEDTHASSATVLAAEGDSNTVVRTTSPAPHSIKNIVFVVIGLALLCLGAIGAYVAYLHYLSSQAPVVAEPVVYAPIFVDEKEEVHDPVLDALMSSLSRALPESKIRLLYEASSTQSIFAKLPVGAPDLLVRNVKNEGSMAGVVRAGGVQSPFFILSVSYSPTLSALLSWEKQMPQALSMLFPPYVAETVASSTATTTPMASTTPKVATTTAVQGPLVAVSFADEVVNNHDVRIYRDPQGRSVLLYGYWNPSTLVIARDPIVYSEILDRLSTSRAK
jgi:hypothetical protein